MSNSLRSFAAFVPVGIIRQLIDTGRPLTVSGESRFLTIFFSDLGKFLQRVGTPVARGTGAASIILFRSRCGRADPGIRQIDKFIGDSVMAFWGAPAEVPDQVYRACVGALRAAHRVGRLNLEWARDGRPQMRVRIGLHCADVIVGNVGSSERLSYTVMGDGVNVASRLEGINKSSTRQFASATVSTTPWRIASSPGQSSCVSVKGRQSKVMVYELIGSAIALILNCLADDNATQLCAMTASAMASLTAGRHAEAQGKYHEILAETPADPVARFMFRRVGGLTIGPWIELSSIAITRMTEIGAMATIGQPAQEGPVSHPKPTFDDAALTGSFCPKLPYPSSRDTNLSPKFYGREPDIPVPI